MGTLRVFCLVVALVASGSAYAGPKSGSSFGGLSGFRSGSGSLSRSVPGSHGSYGGGSSFIFLPSFGWGYGGWGYGAFAATALLFPYPSYPDYQPYPYYYGSGAGYATGCGCY